MKLLKNKWFWVSSPVVVIALILFLSDTAKRYVIYGPTMVAAAGAKLACSGVYVTGRSPETVIKEDLENFYGPFFGYAQYDFDSAPNIVTASVLGVISRSALYRPDVGCTLMHGFSEEELQNQVSGIVGNHDDTRPEEWPVGDQVLLQRNKEEVDWSVLDAAVLGAFDEDAGVGTIDTRAIVVVHDGNIIAERYADGFDKNSRFLGWSASKSVTGALIGTLVMDGAFALDAQAPVPEWHADGDPRAAITLRHLLTMRSGLEFSEPYIPNNDSTDMLFKLPRMGDFAASKPLAHEPGAHWYYSSGTTNLLARLFYDQAGGTLAASYNLAQEKLFKPLGMTSAVFEPDTGGSFVGSSYLYATARDWARFGLLYLNEGRVGDEQILSKEWVDFSRTPISEAQHGEYGAQFWLNAGADREGAVLPHPDLPQDYYMANGYNGQRVGIIPSKNTVIVRLGWSTGGARFDTNKHFSNILAALPDTKLVEVPGR